MVRSIFAVLFVSLLFASPLSGQPRAHVWELQEVELRAALPYGNPYADVECWVELKGPGFSKRVYGFWDGGNVWRLRTRVENGPPDPPTAAQAIPKPGSQCDEVVVYWNGGDERDRARYIVERRKSDGVGGWGEWVTVDSAVDPNATSLPDQGSVSAREDPWGDSTTENRYQYRVWAVDIAAKVGEKTVADAILPSGSTTTTTLGPVTTTTVAPVTTTTAVGTLYWVKIDNRLNHSYNLLIQDENPATADISTSVAKKSIKTIENLPAGNYLITATSPGKPTRTRSFVLDTQAGTIVMELL